VHLPWCVRKCPYCDFNSHTADASADTRRYLQALLKDMGLESRRAGGRTVETVFLGGGTPSFFSAAEIGEVLSGIDNAFRLSQHAEVTMEANPGALERDRLDAYRRAGVNRLSLGAQSFSDESLRRLGRIHGAREIISAFRDAEAAGFNSINLDLMFALPGQSLDMALDDVRAAINLSPAHISYYQLTLEPNTAFHALPPEDLPNEDLSWAIEARGHELLHGAGYRQYETSAFALPGFSCRHNLNYWQFGDYLAIGAGAHGKFTDDLSHVWRFAKPTHPATYMKQCESGVIDCKSRRLKADDLTFEYMLNVLRLKDGFAQADFEARTGLPFSAAKPRIDRAEALGLVEGVADAVWAPTGRGQRFLNDLQALFLPEVYSQ
jgi:putative oxygen-independent coproporphyrinogen III oxidase